MGLSTLILPDIHTKYLRAQQIIDAEKPDKVVCLGDYFDCTGDTDELNRSTAEWLKSYINDDRFVFILGNHDIPYFFLPTKFTKCSGYTYDKNIAIRNVLGRQEINRFRWFYNLDGWLLTHAGLSFHHIDAYKTNNLDSIINFLNKEIERAIIALTVGDTHWLFAAGQSRGGGAKTGGITWCDFRFEFNPIPGIRQIFGHTQAIWPIWLREKPYQNKSFTVSGANEGIVYRDNCLIVENVDKFYDWNLNLDTGLQYYAIWQNDSLTIKYWREKSMTTGTSPVA